MPSRNGAGARSRGPAILIPARRYPTCWSPRSRPAISPQLPPVAAVPGAAGKSRDLLRAAAGFEVADLDAPKGGWGRFLRDGLGSLARGLRRPVFAAERAPEAGRLASVGCA